MVLKYKLVFAVSVKYINFTIIKILVEPPWQDEKIFHIDMTLYPHESSYEEPNKN